MLERRTYRIHELLGRGGFAKVYRARQEVPAGSDHDVAIKILNDPNPPPDVLQRFRDESRILGLVRDRAVVSVEPATRLGDHWAVIMEYVPGASCRALLKHRGIFPARVALEIVQEVARALDHLYSEPGPDGRPLELVHRDIKPGNIQLTQDGQIKILDFGVARARFEAREAHTTRAIQGTYGYIAPERLQGVETPAADTFSLGMVLFKLITMGPTERKFVKEAVEVTRGAEGHALRLAERMCTLDHEERPSLPEVERTCAQLTQRMEGPRLAQWAQQNVPAHIGSSDDPLCGTTLSTTMPKPDVPPPEPQEPPERVRRQRPRSRWGLPAAFGLAGFLGVFALLGGMFVCQGGSLPTLSELGLMQQVDVPTGLEPRVDAQPAVVPEPIPRPATAQPAKRPTPRAAVPAGPPPTPDLMSPPPKPASSTSAQAHSCDFNSDPMGAKVFLDGALIGRTPILGYDVITGAHQIEMRLEGRASTLSIDVGRRKPTTFVWTRGEGWEARY